MIQLSDDEKAIPTKTLTRFQGEFALRLSKDKRRRSNRLEKFEVNPAMTATGNSEIIENVRAMFGKTEQADNAASKPS
jgi:hypothetical protein